MEMELSSKQRAYLRSLANDQPPIVHIGKEGIGPNLIKQTWDALEARELIKIQVMKNAPYDTREACTLLCEKVHAAGANASAPALCSTGPPPRTQRST